MNNDWQSNFLAHILKTKEYLIENSNKTNKLPCYKTTPQFLEKYTKYLRTTFSKTDSNIYLKDAQYQEFRFLKLLECLNTSSNKFKENNKGDRMQTDESSEFTSQILAVNNIIKSSHELTVCVYLLEWLQSIFMVDDIKERIKCTQFDFTKTARANRRAITHPDDFNNSNPNSLDESDKENHIKLLDKIILNIRAGKLYEAEKEAEFHKQGYIGELLSGGLPFHDFLLDPVSEFENVDWDLFPPYMKTREFHEVKDFIKSQSSDIAMNTINERFDSVVGNPNWILWLKSHYMLSDKDSNKIKQIKRINSYISGNSKVIEKDTINIYEYLYFNILDYLNSELVLQYNKTEKLQFNYIPEVAYKSRSRKIIDLLHSVKTQKLFQDETEKVTFLN
jgi:hypothetical protein